ncbi:MAG: hypothetical protein HPZ91_02265 [Lentisphaeria bacterium]|nr:hypothetical protein [Lentisphaeria bacterium]
MLNKAELLNHCPRCGAHCDSVKVCKITRINCLLVVAEWREVMLAGCEKCLRRELGRHLRKSLLTANILWPFFTLPETLRARRTLSGPGHSPEWLNLIDSAGQTARELAENASKPETPPEALPVAAETRHSHGTPYRAPSGNCGGPFAFAILIWALIAVPAGSFLYALTSYFIPYIAATIAVLFAFAMLNGCGISHLATRYGCRSRSGLLLTTLALGIWSVYLGWVGWVWILNEFWSMGLIFDPLRLGRVIHFLATDSMRGMGERLVGAWEWYSYWALEALVLILAPLAVVCRPRQEEPVCTNCGRKLTRLFALRQRSRPVQQQPLKKQLGRGDFAMFRELPLREGSSYLETELLHCSECRDDYLAVVSAVAEQLDDKCRTTKVKSRFAAPVYMGPAETAELSRHRR